LEQSGVGDRGQASGGLGGLGGRVDGVVVKGARMMVDFRYGGAVGSVLKCGKASAKCAETG